MEFVEGAKTIIRFNTQSVSDFRQVLRGYTSSHVKRPYNSVRIYGTRETQKKEFKHNFRGESLQWLYYSMKGILLILRDTPLLL